MESTKNVVFSDTVKRIQTERGSRAAYARREATLGGVATAITPEVAQFVAERDSAYLATASADGQPYVQHRGGPAGFIHVLDEHTLAFADFAGNKQYISTGNLAENDRAFLFLMDYANQDRLKFWGRARFVAPEPELVAKLYSPDYKAKVEQVLIFDVATWDMNCPQHIPRLVHAEDAEREIARLRARIAELEAPPSPRA
jgi:predicted pyridoxine 5'-phosphate oxidase superfamily flavin-nucleotide-binding protein